MSDKAAIRKALRNQARLSEIRNKLSSVFSTLAADKRSDSLSSESLDLLVAQSETTLDRKIKKIEAMKEAIEGEGGLLMALDEFEEVRNSDYRTV